MKENKFPNQKNSEKFIAFSATLFIEYGGVLDYTDNLALQLQAIGKLKAAIAPKAREINRPYKIEEFSIRAERKESWFDKFTPFSKLITLFYFARLYWEIFFEMKRLAKKYPRTTILFTEYYSEPFDIIVACARWQKIPYGIVFHGLDFICAKQKVFNYFKKNYNEARFIVYNSEATKQLCRNQFNFKHSQELILHPGLNVLAIQQKYHGILSSVCIGGENKKRIVFSTISRLVKRKGIDLAIRIVHELKNLNIDIEIIYYIAGVGVEMDSLKHLIQQLNVQSYVKMLGNISEEEKYKLLQESDFFLMPNNSVDDLDFEGFGISLIEASLLGNVVIGGVHGGVREAVENGYTGFLFDFDNKESIHQAVQTIDDCIRKPVLMENIKMQGIDYVKKNYDWNNLIKRFLEFRN